MSGAQSRSPGRWGAVLLLPVATVGVHQLRYLLADGSRMTTDLTRQGDSYVSSLAPFLGVLVALALGVLVLALARPGVEAGPTRRRDRRLWVLWIGASLALVATYLIQETLEVVLGSAHASILAQAFAGGGWCVAPAAAITGLVWALLARGARSVLELACRRARAKRPRDTAALAPARRHPFRAVLAPPSSPLSRRLAGRAPPAAASL